MTFLLRHSTRAFQRNFKPTIRITRTMASATPSKFEWLIIVPDHEGALENRLKVRPAHFEALKSGVEGDFWKMGGAILDEVPAEGDAMKMKGSAMVALASSKEEIMERLKNDIYTKSGVWDLSKIYPFKCAFRYP